MAVAALAEHKGGAKKASVVIVSHPDLDTEFTLKFIRSFPALRMRADQEPVLRSLEVLPVKASSRYQLPEPKVTLAAA